jgi:DUF1680 family protein
MINGEKQIVNNTERVSIKRVWKNSDKVSIKFTMPTIILDGGKSYPKLIALQRGPLVLAFDKTLNGFDAEGLTIKTNHIQLENAENVLPGKWIGGEAFQLKAGDDSSEKNIILVPYADASQTGGVVSTWLKKDNKE